MTIAELDTLYTNASAAIDAGNWDSAISNLVKMEMRLLTMPNQTRSFGQGTQSVYWNIKDVRALIKTCREQKAIAAQEARTAVSGGVFSGSKVTYKRAV